jgi:hypothetical protein
MVGDMTLDAGGDVALATDTAVDGEPIKTDGAGVEPRPTYEQAASNNPQQKAVNGVLTRVRLRIASRAALRRRRQAPTE